MDNQPVYVPAFEIMDAASNHFKAMAENDETIRNPASEESCKSDFYAGAVWMEMRLINNQ